MNSRRTPRSRIGDNPRRCTNGVRDDCLIAHSELQKLSHVIVHLSQLDCRGMWMTPRRVDAPRAPQPCIAAIPDTTARALLPIHFAAPAMTEFVDAHNDMTPLSSLHPKI